MRASVASAVTRWWTRVYTIGLRAEVREARLAEIESDLWESMHDPDVERPQILPRLAGGLLDDVCWRANHLADESRMMWLTIATGCLLLAAMWEWLGRPPVLQSVARIACGFPLLEGA